MTCKNCNLEMIKEKVENGVNYYRCKKCNNELKMTNKELEELYSKVNSQNDKIEN